MARPRSDIQDRILAAAHVQFLAEGVEAASLRRIAKDAETSIGMVYYYYTTKDDLFLAVVETIYQRFLSDLETVLASRQGYRERLCGVYGRIGAMSDNELDVLRLIIRESLTSNDRRDRLMQRFLRGHLPLLMGAILEGIEGGEIDREVHPMVAMACTLGLSGAVSALMQLSKKRSECRVDPSAAPDFMRDVIRGFAALSLSPESIADSMSRIVARALSPEKAT